MTYFIVTEEASLVSTLNEQEMHHDTLTSQLREKDKQIEKLKQSLKGNLCQ